MKEGGGKRLFGVRTSVEAHEALRLAKAVSRETMGEIVERLIRSDPQLSQYIQLLRNNPQLRPSRRGGLKE